MQGIKLVDRASDLAGRVMEALNALPTNERSDELDRATAGLREALSRACDERFDVAVVGEMKAGKSTLLNALVGAEWFPMSSTTCTAKLTVADHGDKWCGEAHFMTEEQWREVESRANRARLDASIDECDQNALKMVTAVGASLGNQRRDLAGTIKSIGPEDMSDYAAVDGRFTPLVDEIHISAPHPFGARVRIVDTPGMFDPDSERVQRTQRYMSRASVVVVVLYAGTPMSAQDYQLLRHELIGVHAVDRILLVLNKMDLLGEDDRTRVVGYVNEKLELLRRDVGAEGPLFLETLKGAKALPCSGQLGWLAAREGNIQDRSHWEGRLTRLFGFETYDQAMELSGLPELRRQILETIDKFDARDRLRKVLRSSESVLRQAEIYWGNCRSEAHDLLDDVRRSSDELETERRRLEDAIVKLTKAVNAAGARVREKADSLKPRARIVQGVVSNMTEDLKATAERHIKALGILDALSSDLALRINNDLSWQIRSTQPLTRLLDDYCRTIGSELPDILKSEMGDLVDDLDPWIVDRVRYSSNVDYPRIDLPNIGELADLEFFQTMFKPGRAREEMRSTLRQMLATWEKEASVRATKALDDISNRLHDEYWGPALDEIDGAVKSRKAAVEAELDARRGSARDVDKAEANATEAMHVADQEIENLRELREVAEGIAHEID